LQALAPALRASFTGADDQARRFAKLQREELFAAVDASLESLKQQLEIVHSIVKKATDAKVQLQEAVDKDPANKKFSTFKAAGGTIDDFFKGLEDRIGEYSVAFCTMVSLVASAKACILSNTCCPGAPSLDFKKAMCAEHTTRGGSTFTFTTGNYNITTQPFKEWAYVVGDESGHRVECPDRTHGREIKPIDELMMKPLARRAKLTEEEMVAVVLYTGAFEYCCIFFCILYWQIS
jgi:hypothetical protein